ncbi:MAG: hypothetical protein CL532_05230 [Aestuariivita sp.]|nr:hypothetical protein [Aestuariivita sp.]
MLNIKLSKRLILGLVAFAFMGTISWAEQAKTKTECIAEEKKFKYLCTLMLMQSGAPLKGAEVTVGATMPSMAMAHNVKPVSVAEHAVMPGRYSFQIQLEMYGEWRLSYDMVKPIRDRLHETLVFTKVGSEQGQMSGHSMDHNDHD